MDLKIFQKQYIDYIILSKVSSTCFHNQNNLYNILWLLLDIIFDRQYENNFIHMKYFWIHEENIRDSNSLVFKPHKHFKIIYGLKTCLVKGVC